MKRISLRIAAFTSVALTLCFVAQAEQPLPADLQPIDAIPPSACTFISMARPNNPPNPRFWLRDYLDRHPEIAVPLFYSPALGSQRVYVGDSAIDYDQVSAEAQVLQLAALAANRLTIDDSGGSGGDGPTPMDASYGTGLWLLLTNVNSQNASLVLTNTAQGTLYEILSKVNLSDSTWSSEGFLLGDQFSTFTNISIGIRTNALFLWARAFVPTNGQLFVTLASANANFAPVINGITNTTLSHLPSPFPDTVYAITNAPLFSLNLGYDASDYEPDSAPPASVIPHQTNQNALAVAGFDPSMAAFTNFCASHNPLTALDLHGLPSLKDIECFQCTNLTTVDVTGCPSLIRACLEQCAVSGVLDFTGDTNLADIRAAANRYTNVVFGGAGPLVHHLCVRDNPQLGRNLVLTNFYSLYEWWMWNDNQTGVVISTSIASSNLNDVRISSNRLDYADFSGQSNLLRLQVDGNRLTNLIVAGCRQLGQLDAHGNQLGTAALDGILTNLVNLRATSGYLDLSGNPQFPSQAGYDAATTLSTLPNGDAWTVILDYRGDGTNGGSDALTFVTLGKLGTSTLNMMLVTNSTATVTWHWADGTTDIGPTNVSHSFTDVGVTHHTNYVTVSPVAAAQWFGKQWNTDPENIIGIYSVSNFTSLYGVYLYNDKVSDLNGT